MRRWLGFRGFRTTRRRRGYLAFQTLVNGGEKAQYTREVNWGFQTLESRDKIEYGAGSVREEEI